MSAPNHQGAYSTVQQKRSKSIRTFIRRQKAEIRRGIPDAAEQNKLISALNLTHPNS